VGGGGQQQLKPLVQGAVLLYTDLKAIALGTKIKGSLLAPLGGFPEGTRRAQDFSKFNL